MDKPPPAARLGVNNLARHLWNPVLLRARRNQRNQQYQIFLKIESFLNRLNHVSAAAVILLPDSDLHSQSK